MNVSLAMTAALYGATVVNHAEVTSLIKDENGRLTGAAIKDCIDERNGKASQQFTVKAKGVINATGPFSDAIRQMDESTAGDMVAPSSGVHVVLPGYYSPARMGLIDPHSSDGRVIFFLPWQGNTIAGTTDTPTTISKNPIPSEKDIDFILSEIRAYLTPDINVRRSDVLAAWSGIRPLVRDPKSANTENLVRSHLVTISPSGLLTCAGGKWTTYRQMAQEAVDAAIEHFDITPKKMHSPPVSGTSFGEADILDGSCQTHQLRLIGAHGWSRTLFINLIQHYGLANDVAQHLAESYGDRAWDVAAMSSPTDTVYPARGVRVTPLFPFIDGEIRYAVRSEYAQTAIDFLARRTRLAFLNAKAALDSLPKVIDLMGEELNWDNKRKQTEWEDTVAFLISMGLHPSRLGTTRKEVEKGLAVKENAEEMALYSKTGRLFAVECFRSTANLSAFPVSRA